MFDDIAPEKGVSAAEQISRSVWRAIAKGELKAGDRLPSVREVARKLNISDITATKAYHELQILGLVKGVKGLGSYVERGVSERCREELLQEVISKLYRVVVEGKATGIALGDLKKMCLDACGRAKEK